MPAPRLLPVLILVFLWAGAAARAQPDGDPGSMYLTAETFGDDRLVDLSTVLWRFQEGDDPAWADPAFGDSTWALSDTDFQPDSLYPDVWQGLGWFRLHLQVDSSLHNTILGMSMYQLGASEAYLDGDYVGGFGEIGAAAEADQPYTPKGLPLTLHFDDSDTHVLAVRYANRSVPAATVALFREDPYLPPGFAVVLGPNPALIHSYVNAVRSFFTEGLLIGILAILTLLHLILFLLDRRDVAYLFFGLATAGFAVALLVGSSVGRRELIWGGTADLALLQQVSLIGFLSFSLFLLLTLYTLFARQWLRYGWVILALFPLMIVFFVVQNVGEKTATVLAQIMSLVLILEALRITAYAVYKRKEGAWILGFGVLVLVGVMVFGLLTGSFNSHVSLTRSFLWETPRLIYPQFYDVILLTLPIPIAMSILLARRFVQRSQRLERELERVEELSAQTLAQEREKQALIASQNERLEADVAARTAELNEKNEALEQTLTELKTTQAQLIQQEKLASLGQLTAGIAHEIKNPLNFVNNFAELNAELAQEVRDELAAHRGKPVEAVLGDLDEILLSLQVNAGQITKHGQRADAIVHAMMQHASGGTGQREMTDLNQLILEHIELAYHGKRAQVPGFNTKIKRDLGEEVGSVELVPQEIGRVLLNLLSNAFDAVQERTVHDNGDYAPTVTVSTRRVDGGVEIQVADNGPGISAEILEKIFEPFFTTKPTGSGTGLGLSLSYDIVTQGHGGTFTVESEAGEGATFIVTLPLRKAVMSSE